MSTRTAYPARPRRGPLRSPLAAAPHSPLPEHRPGASPDRPAAHAAVPDPRSVTLDEFDEYLRTVNNRDGRPYEEAVAKFTPYSKIQDVNEPARDAIRTIITHARERAQPSYIFVNNRLEGNAPATIESICGAG